MPKNFGGCKVCRIRKKKCPGPGSTGGCETCERLNIVCLGGYHQGIEPRYRNPLLIEAIKQWDAVRANRASSIKFCLDTKLRELSEQAGGMHVSEAGDVVSPLLLLGGEHQMHDMESGNSAAHGIPQPTMEERPALYQTGSRDVGTQLWGPHPPIHDHDYAAPSPVVSLGPPMHPPPWNTPRQLPVTPITQLRISDNVTPYAADNSDTMEMVTSTRPVPDFPPENMPAASPYGVLSTPTTHTMIYPPAYPYSSAYPPGYGNQGYETGHMPCAEAPLFYAENMANGGSSSDPHWR